MIHTTKSYLHTPYILRHIPIHTTLPTYIHIYRSIHLYNSTCNPHITCFLTLNHGLVYVKYCPHFISTCESWHHCALIQGFFYFTDCFPFSHYCPLCAHNVFPWLGLLSHLLIYSTTLSYHTCMMKNYNYIKER